MSDAYVSALTTTDNPFDPFKQYDAWYAFDERKGYHSCGYLARIAHCSEGLSPYENLDEIEAAIDEIVKFNLTGNYLKVTMPLSEYMAMLEQNQKTS